MGGAKKKPGKAKSTPVRTDGGATDRLRQFELERGLPSRAPTTPAGEVTDQPKHDIGREKPGS
jgi:hypothetical protein